MDIIQVKRVTYVIGENGDSIYGRVDIRAFISLSLSLYLCLLRAKLIFALAFSIRERVLIDGLGAICDKLTF